MNNGLINIPHSSRMISQFELKDRGDDGSVFTGTGKVLCVCNCGETTGWVEIHEDIDVYRKFFEEHKPAEEIGVRLYFSLGELAGYHIDTNHMDTYLVHACGWKKELLLTDKELPKLVLEVVNNAHVCEIKEEQ